MHVSKEQRSACFFPHRGDVGDLEGLLHDVPSEDLAVHVAVLRGEMTMKEITMISECGVLKKGGNEPRLYVHELGALVAGVLEPLGALLALQVAVVRQQVRRHLEMEANKSRG